MSGVMFENGAADREPLYGCGYRSLYATGATACVAIEAALIERERSGRGQHVGATAATVAASMNYNRGTQYWYNGSLDYRDDPITPRMTLQCADGWIVAFPGGARWAATCAALDLTDLLQDPGLQHERDRMQRWPELRARLQQEVAGRTVADVVTRAQRHRAVLSAVLEPAALLDDPHLAGRGYWQSVDFEGQPRVVLGPWAGSARCRSRRGGRRTWASTAPRPTPGSACPRASRICCATPASSRRPLREGPR